MPTVSSLRLFPDSTDDRCSDGVLERFHLDRNWIVRTIARSSGSDSISRVQRLRDGCAENDPAAAFDASWLRATNPPPEPSSKQTLRIADLFSGCGGLSLGIREACRALGISPRFMLASDLYAPAIDVYQHNFAPAHSIAEPLETQIDGELGDRSTASERKLQRTTGPIDLVVSGPPCQGHSDLNNHTRRTDPKNSLVLRVVRFAEIFEPTHVLIENVQGIRHDRSGALSKAKDRLRRMGYNVTDALVSADSVGVPQSRRRYFLFASKLPVRTIHDVATCFGPRRVTVRWAIGDLRRASREMFDQPSLPTPVNRQRIDYLFDNDLYNLPNDQRPLCHLSGEHSYNAVYGRLKWNEPAPTITTGFGCMGQGRFVHPAAKRTITPHEAARLQSFPDFFDFGQRRRGEYQQLIGNAVPPKLAYAVLVHQLA